MKKTISQTVLFMAIAILFFSLCFAAGTIEIKGLRTGLTIKEVEKIIGGPIFNGFTRGTTIEETKKQLDQYHKAQSRKKFSIGGVTEKDMSFTWENNKLVSLWFFFYPKDFDKMVDAVKGKYPDLTCSSKQVGNLMGAKFEQLECSVMSGQDGLWLTRFNDDIYTSVLTIQSLQHNRQQSEKQNKEKKDI